MRQMLSEVYRCGMADNWSGSLIQIETNKVHETIRIVAKEMTAIICAPNASKENKAWAKEQLERLMNR